MTNTAPREAIGDDAHRMARAALAAIPCVGGAAVELLSRVVVPPVQRRRDAWLDELAARVSELEQRGQLRVEDLQHDETFISCVMHATQIADRSHQREKIDALRNAVLNTALGNVPEETKQQMFLVFVDGFTTSHMQVLKALDAMDNSPRRNYIKGSIRDITEKASEGLPALRQQRALAEIVVEDLCRRGLLFWNRDGGILTVEPLAKQVSDLGREFLRFISDPPVAH